MQQKTLISQQKTPLSPLYFVLKIGFASCFLFFSACTGNRGNDQATDTTDTAAISRDLQAPEDMDINASDSGSSTAQLMMQESTMKIRMGVLNDELFEGNTARIQPSAQGTLRRILAILNQKGTGKVMITGHSGIGGDSAEKQRLSAERAKAVMDWLKAQKLDMDLHLSYQGVGDRYPMLANTNEDGSPNEDNQRMNQRLEVVVRKATK